MIDLPNEIILAILDGLSLAEYKQLHLVCRRLQQFIRPILWRQVVVGNRANAFAMFGARGIVTFLPSVKELLVAEPGYIHWIYLCDEYNGFLKITSTVRFCGLQGVYLKLNYTNTPLSVRNRLIHWIDSTSHATAHLDIELDVFPSSIETLTNYANRLTTLRLNISGKTDIYTALVQLDAPNLTGLHLNYDGYSDSSGVERLGRHLPRKWANLRQLTVSNQSAVSVERVLCKAATHPSLDTVAIISASNLTGAPSVDELIQLMRRCQRVKTLLLDSELLARCGFLEGFVVVLEWCTSLDMLWIDAVPPRWAERYHEYFTQEHAPIEIGFAYPPYRFDINLFKIHYGD